MYLFKNGRMKVFGNYGKYYDVMKLNLAISSFGGQYWDSCFYALNTPDLSSVIPGSTRPTATARRIPLAPQALTGRVAPFRAASTSSKTSTIAFRLRPARRATPTRKVSLRT